MKLRLTLFIPLSILIIACSSNEKLKEKNEKKQVMAGSVAADSNIVQLTAEQIQHAGIITGQPEQKAMHATLKVNGVLDVPPQNIISISVPLGGYLKRMVLIPGQKINKGSILAVLEDPQYIQLQQDYLVAQSRLQFLETDYIRQKGLNETKATSDKVLQQVQSELNSQKILRRSLAEKLRLISINPETLSEGNITRSINIYAPISGYVSKVNVNIGKYVSPTDVLFELINPDDLHLRLTVFENDAARLSTGQKIVCFTNSNPSDKYKATIHYITPNIQENGSTDVHCHLEHAGKQLLPGSYMNAVIELSAALVASVPDEAVIKWQGKHYMFSEEPGNRFRMLPVEPGISENGYTEIKGWSSANKIVTENAYTVLMKMKNNEGED